MAEPRFLERPLDILGAAGKVEGIKAQRAATGLAQSRFGLAQDQLALENKRQVEQDAIAERERRFTRLGEERERNEKALLDTNITEEHATLLIGRNNDITSELTPGSVDIDPKVVVGDLQGFRRDVRSFNALEEQLGEDNPQVGQVFDALKSKYAFDPNRIAIIEKAGVGVTGEQKFEKGIEQQKRLFQVQQEQAGVLAKTKQAQELETTVKTQQIKQGFAETELSRKESVIRGLGLDPALEQTVLASMQAGVTLPDPEAAKRAKRQESIQTLQIVRQQLSDVDINEEFIVTGQERKQLETLRGTLLNRILGEVSPGRTVESIKKVKALSNPEDLIAGLVSLGTAGELNPADYLDKVFADKANFKAGKIKVTNEQLFRDYEELLALTRAKLGTLTFLGSQPPSTQVGLSRREAQQGAQKAIPVKGDVAEEKIKKGEAPRPKKARFVSILNKLKELGTTADLAPEEFIGRLFDNQENFDKQGKFTLSDEEIIEQFINESLTSIRR